MPHAEFQIFMKITARQKRTFRQENLYGIHNSSLLRWKQLEFQFIHILPECCRNAFAGYTAILLNSRPKINTAMELRDRKQLGKSMTTIKLILQYLCLCLQSCNGNNAFEIKFFSTVRIHCSLPVSFWPPPHKYSWFPAYSSECENGSQVPILYCIFLVQASRLSFIKNQTTCCGGQYMMFRSQLFLRPLLICRFSYAYLVNGEILT
jgi:hypothetical protein